MKPTTIFILLFILIVALAGGIQYMIDSNDSEQNNNNQTGDKMTNIVVFETSKGNFEVELFEEKAPITVANFKKYVAEGFYDGTIFHRVMKDFMVQGGGFTPDGQEKENNRTPIKLEVSSNLRNTKGTIAMARTMDPNSATNQFFINTKDNAFLNPGPSGDGYAVFGNVTSGMDVIMAIEKVKTTSKGYHDDWPVEDVVINKVYFKE